MKEYLENLKSEIENNPDLKIRLFTLDNINNGSSTFIDSIISVNEIYSIINVIESLPDCDEKRNEMILHSSIVKISRIG